MTLKADRDCFRALRFVRGCLHHEVVKVPNTQFQLNPCPLAAPDRYLMCERAIRTLDRERKIWSVVLLLLVLLALFLVLLILVLDISDWFPGITHLVLGTL